MSGDSFDDLLNLEDNYYQEGYALGEADGTHAGLVEGKLFGVEKGFEKAMSMGRLSGRAEVWRWRGRGRRSQPSSTTSSSPSSQPSQTVSLPSGKISPRPTQVTSPSGARAATPIGDLPPLSANARLERHIESLSAITDSASMSGKNSDDAVADFDERLAKAIAKAKVISNIVAEPLHVEEVPVHHGHRSIEESGSLPARP